MSSDQTWSSWLSRASFAPPWRLAVLERWAEAGLPKPSCVKPVFVTLERGLVLRRLGELALVDQLALREAIRQILG